METKDNFTEELNKKVEELQVDLTKFEEKNNKSAGTRVRKSAMEIINMMKELRKQVLNKRNLMTMMFMLTLVATSCIKKNNLVVDEDGNVVEMEDEMYRQERLK